MTDSVNTEKIAPEEKEGHKEQEEHKEQLALLEAASIINTEQHEKALKLLDTEQATKTPWFVHVLQGLGAWFSAIMFIIFFVMLSLFNGITTTLITLGVFLVATALILSIKIPDKSSYLSQLLFVTSLTGHVLLVVGIGVLQNNDLLVALTLGFISVLCIIFYVYPVHQFLSVHLLLFSLLLLAYEIGVWPLSMSILMVTVILLTCWLWFNESRYIVNNKRYVIFRPIQYALVSALVWGAMTIDHTDSLFDVQLWLISTPFLFYAMIAFGFFCGFVWLIQHVFQRLQLEQKSQSLMKWGLIVLMFVLCVLFYYSPSILASLFILLLGIERHNRIIITSAVVVLIYAIGHYYYWLELTLLHKSLLLMGSGVILLAAGIVSYLQGQKKQGQDYV